VRSAQVVQGEAELRGPSEAVSGWLDFWGNATENGLLRAGGDACTASPACSALINMDMAVPEKTDDTKNMLLTRGLATAAGLAAHGID